MRLAILAAAAAAAVSVPALAVDALYFVAVDSAPTLAFGVYAGLPNPNAGRLSFLYAHVFPDTPTNNHYHGIGVWSYSGPVASPTVTPTNANNRIPELYTGLGALTLHPGAGAFAGRFVSGIDDGSTAFEEYGRLTIRPVDILSGFAPGTPEAILFNSSSGRYASALAGTPVALRLVEISDGLSVSDEAGNVLLDDAGEQIALGVTGDWSFTPVFSVDGSAAPNRAYAASFQLIGGGAALEGGTFHFDLRVVPEPGTGVLLAGTAALALRRRR